jgi:MFS family permease
MFNLARLVGPALAGYVINWSGAGGCYLADGISYLAVIISLLMMRLRENPQRPKHQHPWLALEEGFRSAFGFAPIRALIVVVGLVSFLGFGYTVLTPVFARDVFQGDARTLGHLMAASGVGALLAAMYLGTRTTVRGLGNVITIGGLLMGLGIIGFSRAPSVPVGMLCLAFAGGGGVLLMASSNTIVQSLIEDNQRGRVMSIFTMAFTGTMPLGNLVIGSLADRFGVRTTLLISGISCLLVVFFFFRELPRLRRIAGPVLARLNPNAAEPMVYTEEDGKVG